MGNNNQSSYHNCFGVFPINVLGEHNCLGSLPEDYLMLYSFVAAVKPKLIIELGTHCGFSAMAMAKAMHDYNIADGKILTIDSHAQGHYADRARKTIINANLQKYVEFYYGNSWDVCATFAVALEGKIDLVYIDASHKPEDVLKDFESIRGKTRYIIFHDSYQSKGVLDLVNLIFTTEENYEIINLPTRSYIQRAGVTVGMALCRDRTLA